MAKNKPFTRQQALQRLLNVFDAAELDYERQLRPIKQKGLLLGVATALLLYALVFFLGLDAADNQTITNEMFIKMSWYLTVPSIVMGMVVWMITINKLENRLRERLMRDIRHREGHHGLLWRFTPVFTTLVPDNAASLKLCQHSQHQQFRGVDPVEYLDCVNHLYQMISDEEKYSLSDEVLSEIQLNFKQPKD